MIYKLILGVFITLALPLAALADQAQIKSAESAGPASVSKNATIKDWNMKVIRKGTNEWTCLPDNADTPGPDPWCVNEPWLNFLDALMNKKDPSYKGVGVAYMLAGDTGVSNIDPAGTKENTPPDQWVDNLKSHVMILVPDIKSMSNISTDPKNGGSWIMWPKTPYAHIMLPIDSYPSK
ncbi:MAG TPA: hypothetical protein VLB09_01250 [Nitrospiria bacterium]|nr:hypothetical protein [Nitrospiria bacterium]